MINGYSGFIPLSTFYIRRVFNGFPSRASLDILKALNIKYAVVHPKLWDDEKAARVMGRLKSKYPDELKEVAHFKYETDSCPELAQFLGNDFIYEVSPKNESQPVPPEYQEIPRSDWEVKASIREDLLPKLKDDRLDTIWTTARVKKTDDFFIVEFKQPRPLVKASLFLGQVPTDFALDLKVETSSDGVSWQLAPHAYSPGEFTVNLIHSPKDTVQQLSLKGKSLRFLKITQIGDDPDWYWSVAELKLYEQRGMTLGSMDMGISQRSTARRISALDRSGNMPPPRSPRLRGYVERSNQTYKDGRPHQSRARGTLVESYQNRRKQS